MTNRCNWGNSNLDPLYRQYHDEEWGKLNLDNKYLYEMLVLESFQSGLSWTTILKKRENFRKAFADFDYYQVAKFDQTDFERLMNDEGIVRNKLKINAAINNAQVLVKLEQSGTNLKQILQEAIPEIIVNHPQEISDIPASNTISKKLSVQLKKIGFKFVGPTTMYSFLQAVGLINDHLDSCDFKY